MSGLNRDWWVRLAELFESNSSVLTVWCLSNDDVFFHTSHALSVWASWSCRKNCPHGDQKPEGTECCREAQPAVGVLAGTCYFKWSVWRYHSRYETPIPRFFQRRHRSLHLLRVSRRSHFWRRVTAPPCTSLLEKCGCSSSWLRRRQSGWRADVALNVSPC